MKFINKIKENLENPKKKSLTLLAIYFIFFAFVFLTFRMPNIPDESIEPMEESVSTLDNYKNMNSYQYKVNFIDNGINNIIEGTYVNNTSLFTYNNLKYYYENDLLYVIDNDSYYLSNIQYNIVKFFNSNLYKILLELKEESKTTYNDGKVETNYLLSTDSFNNYYYGTESNYLTNISLKIVENNNYIASIIIDLSNLNMTLSRIEIEYSNINNMKSLEFNKDNYIYKE